MKRTFALIASTALLMPAAVLASPATAAEATHTSNVTNCLKTHHGVKVRVKVTMLREYTRVRVSHPGGRGKLRNAKVARVSSTDGYATHSSPSWRTKYSPLLVRTVFTLRTGQQIKLTCSDSNTAVSLPKRKK